MNDNVLVEQPREISFPCLQASQPIGIFYVGVMRAQDLCDVSFFDVRRRLQEERDVERYLGIQRPLNERRVEELKRYVRFHDATFPTSIILAVDQRCARYDASQQRMFLSNASAVMEGDVEIEPAIYFRSIARVLDGQHRIAGLDDFPADFELSVSLFVGIDIADQAQIFATVNLEQTKVSKSLAYDLFALAKTRSPQKTCHQIAVALDQSEESPFFHRIKRLGVATEGRYGETLTQATFVEALLRYISRDPKGDRDLLLKGERLPTPTHDELARVPLRTLFADAKDVEIGKIVWNYFDAIRSCWPKAWSAEGKGYMLNRTNGFRAAMRIFGQAYLHLVGPGQVPSTQEFRNLFNRSELRDDQFTTENFPPGSSGEALLANKWRLDLGL